VPVLKITRSETKSGMAANVKDNLEAFGCRVDFLTGNIKSIKKRFIHERSKQHILRVDEDHENPPFNPSCIANIHQYDAVVISDYNKGFVEYTGIEEIIKIYKGPIFIDTKKPDLSRFEGAYVKINDLEYNNSQSECKELIVTLGGQGVRYKDKIYPAPNVEVVDVCGAGDTFLAALTYKFLESKNLETAIEFANEAGSISVQHSGVYFLSLEDIKSINY
jgi:bifunctional ADP-heptose synthase (sugar kinase/adenylyltransferase)